MTSRRKLAALLVGALLSAVIAGAAIASSSRARAAEEMKTARIIPRHAMAKVGRVAEVGEGAANAADHPAGRRPIRFSIVSMRITTGRCRARSSRNSLPIAPRRAEMAIVRRHRVMAKGQRVATVRRHPRAKAINKERTVYSSFSRRVHAAYLTPRGRGG